ncbi:hypothetical protein HY933_03370 [Candidatus Falkowbacteria bacterium]|nr:hypothetical protein [Candidatus Falkowbacteria bacterium]
MKIFFGLLIIGFSFLITWKAEWILQNFGGNAWAEAKLGSSGGSRLFYKLIGVVGIFLGLLVMTGLIQDIIFSFMRTFFHVSV